MCTKLDVGCAIQEGFRSVVTDQFDAIAVKVGKAAASGLDAVGSFWLEIDSPTLATEHGSNWTASDPVAFLHGRSMIVAASIFTFAVLVAGIRTAWEQRGHPIQELLRATMLMVLVCGAGTATLQLLTALSDAFALDLIQQAKPASTEFHQALGGVMIKGGIEAATQQLPLMVAMFFGIAIFMASLIQVVLLLIRSAMLVVLAGTFPLAAAATNTEVGKAWFKKYCAWALAFVAYKPAAAMIYAAAMKMNQAGMTNTSGNSLVQAMTGLMMMLLAVFALPALLRFAVPITAAVSGGSAGMGAGVADPGGLATGAVNVGRSAFGRSSAGGGGGGGGGGGSASGALGVAASAGLGVAGAAVGGAKKAGGALAGAAAHSAGEAGGGSAGGASNSGGGRGWRSGRRGSSGGRSKPPTDQPREPAGPSGSR